MSRIFVSFYNFIRDPADYFKLPPYYSTFVNGLLESGNDILCYAHKNYSETFERDIPENILSKIRDFKPDCAVLFNNEFYDISSLDIPICVYVVDSPLYIKNKKKIIKNSDAYKFCTIQSDNVALIAELFKIKKERIIYLPPFTGVKANYNEEKVRNICFVGANWLWEGARFVNDFIKQDSDLNDLKIAFDAYKSFERNPFAPLTENYQNYKGSLFDNYKENANRVSGILRARYLTAVASLGLEVRGLYWKAPNLAYYPELALSVSDKPVLSLEDTEKFYNSSIIGFNNNHIQATSGFSWRVCDTMASSACLVTQFSPDLKKLFPRIKIPTFTNEYEAYSQCKLILSDSALRNEIVLSCNEAIDANHRVGKVLRILDQFMGVPIVNHKKPDHNCSMQFISENEFQPSKDNFFNRIEKKYPRAAYFVERKFIQATSLLLPGKDRRIKYRATNTAELIKRIEQGKRYSWYLKKYNNMISLARRIGANYPSRKIRVGFFVIFDSVFPAENVFKLMRKSKYFDPKIIVIPDISRGNDNTFYQLEKTLNSMKAKYGGGCHFFLS